MSSKELAKLADDPMEGITTKTTKADLIERIKTLGFALHKNRQDELTELQELEARIRAKHNPGDYEDLKRVILAAPESELDEAYEFLKDFEDLMPPAIQRFHMGLAMLLSKPDDDLLDPDDQGEFKDKPGDGS